MRSLYLLLILSIISCSDDNPTASIPTLDTTPKTHTLSFDISRWDGSGFVNTGSQIDLVTTWRFTSYEGDIESDVFGGRLRGGYSVEYINPTGDSLNVVIQGIRFTDELGLTIIQNTFISADYYDVFKIPANSSITRNSTFNIYAERGSIAELMTQLRVFGVIAALN
jgi:hypothetical protein